MVPTAEAAITFQIVALSAGSWACTAGVASAIGFSGGVDRRARGAFRAAPAPSGELASERPFLRDATRLPPRPIPASLRRPRVPRPMPFPDASADQKADPRELISLLIRRNQKRYFTVLHFSAIHPI